MDLYLNEEYEDAADLMDVVEAVLQDDERFASERVEDGDIQFGFRSMWGEVVGYFSLREELPALLFTVSLGLTAPQERRDDAARLIALINENLWLGHFVLWDDDGSIVFQHASAMIGRAEVTAGEIQALLAAATDAADRFHPAFHFLLAGGKTAREAAAAALFETAGAA